MTCVNIDSDANVFAQNCIIFVHCAMFCLEYISVCMYVCMRASCMFILHTSSACILHAVHSHSCICLLRGVAYSLGVIAYILLSCIVYLVVVRSCTWCGYRTSVMPRSTLTLLFLFGCCCFTSAFVMPWSGLFTDCPCTLFVLYVSTHVLLVAILFFGWCLCTWLVSLYLVQKRVLVVVVS